MTIVKTNSFYQMYANHETCKTEEQEIRSHNCWVRVTLSRHVISQYDDKDEANNDQYNPGGNYSCPFNFLLYLDWVCSRICCWTLVSFVIKYVGGDNNNQID